MTVDCVYSIKFASFAGYIWQLEREQILLLTVLWFHIDNPNLA